MQRLSFSILFLIALLLSILPSCSDPKDKDQHRAGDSDTSNTAPTDSIATLKDSSSATSNDSNKAKGEMDTDGQEDKKVPHAPKTEKELTISNMVMSERKRVPNTGRYDREDYEHTPSNSFKKVMNHPLSTFSIDVDRASYSNARRFINDDELPPADAIRTEEFINYFEYDYPEPTGRHPFSIHSDLAQCPWKKEHQLLRIGLQGEKVDKADAAPSNLVFLLDVSGSMRSSKKLALVKRSMKLLTNELRPEDRISIVVYAGASGVVLEPSSGAEKEKIRKALNGLSAGGSTAGSEGIELAYQMAEKHYKKEGNNRVILATDGDFNVGTTSDGELVRLIEKKREKGIFLSVMGFGKGNYQGGKMEQLSNKGNGNYAYIDNILEAKKTMVNEFGGTMYTIAKDVKVQIELNPSKVAYYRLIGYENRQLDKEDFNDDSVDAGELGSGHSVTALYELVPPGEEPPKVPGKVDSLKYQQNELDPAAGSSSELATVKFRYKEPDGDKSSKITRTVQDRIVEDPGQDFLWSASTAMFAMQLRDSPYKGSTNYSRIRSIAESNVGDDQWGYRSEFLELVKKASVLEDTKNR